MRLVRLAVTAAILCAGASATERAEYKTSRINTYSVMISCRDGGLPQAKVYEGQFVVVSCGR